MELSDIRQQIDAIDSRLTELFCERMRLCAQAGAVKRREDLPLADPAREEQILALREQQAGDELASYARQLFALLLTLSKDYQGQEER